MDQLEVTIIALPPARSEKTNLSRAEADYASLDVQRSSLPCTRTRTEIIHPALLLHIRLPHALRSYERQGPREGSTPVSSAPPPDLHELFSSVSAVRDLSLCSRVMRKGLFTGPGAQ